MVMNPALPAITMPRHSKPYTEQPPRIYRPPTQAERDMGLYTMLFAIVGMIVIGIWWIRRR